MPAVSQGRRWRHSLREEDEGREEEEEMEKEEEKMMEEVLPLLLLCWQFFSLLKRTLSKREDQSSDHTSLLFTGLGIHLERNIFSVMPAVWFVLNSY